MELEIYNRQGILKKKVSPDSSSRWTEEVGAEFVVTVNFTTWEFFVLSVGDYVEISGKRFSIKKEYRPKKTDTQKYTYNISFYGREHDMQDLLFCRLNQGEDDLESVFAYDGTPMEMLEKLVANMNRNTDGVTWRAGQAVTGDRKTINFNGLFCWDAAGEIAGAWETEWWLDGEYLNIGKCEHGERVTLGYMKGLKTGLTQNENSNSIKWFTRLIPVGSTKNIDPSKYGYTHLQLPSRDKYIDLNTQLGLKEHREEAAFEDIFPHRLGTVSSVRSEEQTNTDGEEYTVYYVKDKDLPFNPDEYMIGEEVIHITFESGDLSGREFECNWHNGTQEFEIINTYPDENTQIPGGNIIPQAGDTYILTNIRMPDEYYPIAEEQYKQAVDSFLTEYSKDISIYSGDTDYIHVDKNSVPLSLGQRVRLEDAQYFEAGYLDTRITRIERKLGNLSEASIDCSSAVSTSWKSSVDSTLNNLEYTLAQEMAQANVRLLKTGDMESPSDYTAFSSLRAIGTFLRKNIADIASEIITFLKGLKVGKFVTGLIGGSGAAIWFDKNGKTIVEADKAMFREELIVPQITFNCIDVISGDKANSFAYGRIKTVDTENRIATLELLEGQWGTLHVSDICRGILHNISGSNHTKDEYGPNGFMEYSGYATSYFTPTRIIENEAGNMKFEYALQAGTSVHPLPGMNFFAYGNFTDKDRQDITYENRSYLRRLVNVNTWVIDPDVNIAYQNGNLSGLTVNGQVMDGYSSFQDKVYIRGTIERLKPNGEVAMDLSYEGVWQSGRHYDYYDSVTYNGSTWACLNKNGSSSEPGTDADWQEIASKGSKGDKGDGYTQMGQFRTGMVVPKMGVVSMGGGSYVAKASTTNPPLWCWTDNAGNRFTFNDGGYVLTGEVNTTEYDVWSEKGDTGAKGDKGDKGDDGEKGDKGDKGDQGVQGIQGCIFRESEWSASSVQYRNDEALTSGTRYIDFALIRNDAAIDGWDVYKCLKTHVSSASNKPGNTTYWEKLSGVGPIYTSLIIAKNASISLFQGNQVLIKKSDNTVTAGMSGSTSGQKIRIWAGSATPDSAPFRVDEEGNVVATKANITGTITATGGNVGGFSISSSSMESVSGDDAMLLSANLIRFTGSYSKVFMGAETMPSSNGGSFSTPVRIEVNRSIQSMSYGNAGLFLSVEGSHAYDNKDYQFTGNHALYISKGDICGFRLRLRRIDESTILSVMDSVVLAIKAGITLTVPSTAEDGQFYWIRNTSNDKVYIAGTRLVGWESGEISSSMYLMASSATAMYYDKRNNIWFMNWIGFWT
jgi:hypothetical protein